MVTNKQTTGWTQCKSACGTVNRAHFCNSWKNWWLMAFHLWWCLIPPWVSMSNLYKGHKGLVLQSQKMKKTNKLLNFILKYKFADLNWKPHRVLLDTGQTTNWKQGLLGYGCFWCLIDWCLIDWFYWCLLACFRWVRLQPLMSLIVVVMGLVI